jgi:hypothetical protein
VVRCSFPFFPSLGYLTEQALELWHTVLQYAPASSYGDLSVLFPNWLKLNMLSIEHIEVTVGILESYLLLGKGDLMTQHAGNIATVINSGAIRERDKSSSHQR